jgi:GntR family transcriptional regulator of arabinose operon
MLIKDLCNAIQHEIAYEYDDKLPSIAQLAQRHKVCDSTIKKALSMLKDMNFIEGLQGKCLLINPAAAGNPFFKRNVVVYVHMNILGNPFYLRVMNYLNNHLSEACCQMTIINSLKQLMDSHLEIDVIIAAEINDPDEIAQIEKCCSVEQIILLNCENSRYSSICSDNENVGFMALEYLHKQCNYREIAVIGDELDRKSFSLSRLQGAKAYAEKHPEITLSIGTIEVPADAEKCACSLLTQRPETEAIFVLKDFFAIGVYSYCQEAGLNIPSDIAVIGVDNRDFSSMLLPPLSTIQEDTTAIAGLSYEGIKNIILGKFESKYQIIKPVLIKRASTQENN